MTQLKAWRQKFHALCMGSHRNCRLIPPMISSQNTGIEGVWFINLANPSILGKASCEGEGALDTGAKRQYRCNAHVPCNRWRLNGVQPSVNLKPVQWDSNSSTLRGLQMADWMHSVYLQQSCGQRTWLRRGLRAKSQVAFQI